MTDLRDTFIEAAVWHGTLERRRGDPGRASRDREQRHPCRGDPRRRCGGAAVSRARSGERHGEGGPLRLGCAHAPLLLEVPAARSARGRTVSCARRRRCSTPARARIPASGRRTTSRARVGKRALRRRRRRAPCGADPPAARARRRSERRRGRVSLAGNPRQRRAEGSWWRAGKLTAGQPRDHAGPQARLARRRGRQVPARARCRPQSR